VSGFTIERLHVPTPAEAAAAADAASDFSSALDVRNAVDRATWGHDDFAFPLAQAIEAWQPDPDEPRLGWVAKVDGRVVARAAWDSLLGDGAATAWLDLRVHPDFRGMGIGTALADLLEREARERGATKAISYVASPAGDGERLASPTGFGSVPAGNPEVRFLLARGWRLEQVERASRIALPVDDALVARLQRETVAAAGPDYRVETWTGATPPHRLADMAHLVTRMSTDAPTAGLEEPEDVWTPERVAEHERRTIAGGVVVLTAVAEHVPTGRLAGFTALHAPPERTAAVQQEDTLVLAEHRGHRLGMLLKLANLRRLAAERPGHPSIVTFNAEENRHMLSVNEAVGFVPIGAEGAWRKDL
jgi:GNAT superfamily N-acetyltransferase